ncbi:MAG: hypothetical protein LBP58_07485 [Azoarcus sp.]|jgi:hypothetical protein|nr:hypothetical protein [Azoarcus sp.]
MPNFVRTALLYLTGYARIVILIGIGLTVFSIWSQWKASDDNAYVQRDKLQTVSGFVKEASEITVTGTHARQVLPDRGRAQGRWRSNDVAD